MPRFYLDVLNGRRVLEDPDGQEFADVNAAMIEAVASARDLVAHGIMRNEDMSGRSFIVRDEKGETVATVPFRDALPGALSGSPLPGSDGRVLDQASLATLDTDLERVVEEHGRAFDEGERRFRDLIEALPAAIYTTDAEGRITFYNEAAVELSGRRPEVGRDRWCVTWRLYQLDGTPLPHDECAMAIAIKENRPIRGIEAMAERPDGTRIPILPFPTPLRDVSGEVVGAVNMLVDLSHRKRAEEGIGLH